MKSINLHRNRYIAAPMLALILLASCGGGFASQLRLILAASGPLIQSLPLSEKVKTGLVADFTDLADGAASLGDDLKACGDSKPCKLTAVDRFQKRFWDIQRRDHFKLSPKLEKVESILAGIISAAKIYYGGPAPSPPGSRSRVVTEGNLKAQLEELKAVMRP